MGYRWVLLLGCTVMLAQPLKDPKVLRRLDETRKGRAFVIEEVLLPPKDSLHDYYPVLRVTGGGKPSVEITPEMLSAVMEDDDVLLPCDKLREAERRQCFGKGFRGPIQYFSLTDPGLQVRLFVELDTGANRNFLSFTVDLDPPHQVLRGWTMNGSGISIGVPSPYSDDGNPNEEWFFYACTITSRGPDPVMLAVIRPAYSPSEGGNVIYLGASSVGAPATTTRVDFENLKWVGFKELAFDVIFYGPSATEGEVVIGRSRKVYDVVVREFLQGAAATPAKKTTKAKPAATKAKQTGTGQRTP